MVLGRQASNQPTNSHRRGLQYHHAIYPSAFNGSLVTVTFTVKQVNCCRLVAVGWLLLVACRRLAGCQWLVGCLPAVGWMPVVGWLVAGGWLVGRRWLLGCRWCFCRWLIAVGWLPVLLLVADCCWRLVGLPNMPATRSRIPGSATWRVSKPV